MDELRDFNERESRGHGVRDCDFNERGIIIRLTYISHERFQLLKPKAILNFSAPRKEPSIPFITLKTKFKLCENL